MFAHLGADIEEHWQSTIDAGDPSTDTEALHDLRVALRRTRSVLANSKGVVSAETLDHFRDEFAWLAGATGPTRDLDVFIAAWHTYVDDLDTQTVVGLLPVLDHLHRHRRIEFESLVEVLASERAERLLALWSAELTALGADVAPTGSHAHRRLGRVVRKRIQQAQRRLIRDGREITDGSEAGELHALRKDAKKLRYLIECFGGLLGHKTSNRFVRRLKELQDDLGRHQDAEVHAELLRTVAADFGREHASKATVAALGRLADRIESDRVAARDEFAARFDRYDSKKTRHALGKLLKPLT